MGLDATPSTAARYFSSRILSFSVSTVGIIRAHKAFVVCGIFVWLQCDFAIAMA